ncbi:MAG: hypothetical protein F4073_01280 [Rhodobacteraceae bacterium]|nr:hypothetical protein [Paracoccaceae bacterium]
MKWFQLAAEQGHAEAHDSLALVDQETGSWEFSSSEDKMDDSKIDMIMLRDDSVEKGWLIIRCRNNTTDLMSIWFDGIYYNQSRGVGIFSRIDKEESTGKRWVAYTNQVASAGEGSHSINFIKEMFGHERLILQTVSYGDRIIDATYSIKGIENAVKPIREACNW